MSRHTVKQGRFVSFLTIAFIFSHTAYAESGKGLIDGKLAVCPDKPNCVSTEDNALTPISIHLQTPEEAWLMLKTVITEMGGKIIKFRSDYLWASFETSFIKFTDDVEARLDLENKVIHLRSASRVGYYDFNVNNKRLKRIIKGVSIKLEPDDFSRFKNINE